MALDQTKVGTVYPSYVYEVSREKVREYAIALGETDPRYHADDDTMIAPPTFAACFTIVKGLEAAFGDPDLGAHTKLVHGSQGFTFGDRPLRPGDVLECTPKIRDITVRGPNEFLTIEIDCRFRDGGLAVLAEETIVFLESAPSDGME